MYRTSVIHNFGKSTWNYWLMRFNNTTFLFFLSLALIITGCQQKNTSTESEDLVENKELPVEERANKVLHDEIIGVHDEVMPKMDVIMGIKGELLARLDSLRDIESAPAEVIEKIEAEISALENANESMMSWMRNWQPPADSIPQDDKLKFYEEQKVAIEQVKEEMLQSIENGQKLLELN